MEKCWVEVGNESKRKWMLLKINEWWDPYKPSDLLVSHGLWRRKYFRNSIKVKKAAFGRTLSSSNCGC